MLFVLIAVPGMEIKKLLFHKAGQCQKSIAVSDSGDKDRGGMWVMGVEVVVDTRAVKL